MTGRRASRLSFAATSRSWLAGPTGVPVRTARPAGPRRRATPPRSARPATSHPCPPGGARSGGRRRVGGARGCRSPPLPGPGSLAGPAARSGRRCPPDRGVEPRPCGPLGRVRRTPVLPVGREVAADDGSEGRGAVVRRHFPVPGHSPDRRPGPDVDARRTAASSHAPAVRSAGCDVPLSSRWCEKWRRTTGRRAARLSFAATSRSRVTRPTGRPLRTARPAGPRRSRTPRPDPSAEPVGWTL